MYFVSIPATGKPACCATFPNGHQENKPNGATLSISVILLQDILALRTRVPLPSSRAVELWHLQKLQHFASESPGKQISRHPHDLDPSRASTSAACDQTRDDLNSATGLVRSILWESRRATSTYPTRLTHEPVLEAFLPPNGLDFRLLEQNGRTNPPRR